MDKMLIVVDGSVPFSDYLNLHTMYELYLARIIQTYMDKVHIAIKDAKIENIACYAYESCVRLIGKYCIIGSDELSDFDIEINREFNYKTGKYTDEIRKEERYGIRTKPAYEVLANKEVFNFILKEIEEYRKNVFEKSFMIGDECYTLIVDSVLDYTIFPFGSHFKRLIIKSSTGKTDIFFYNAYRRVLYIKSDKEYIPLPKNIVDNILAHLPNIEYKEMPEYLKKMIIKFGKPVYFNRKKGVWSESFPNILEDLFKGRISGYLLDVVLKLEERSSISFVTKINGKNSLIVNANAQDIVGNIKRSLLNLKENCVILEEGQKFKLTDTIFFISSTDEKKEIDDFFKDPEILKNCDLSEIDFTKANIEGLDLSNNREVVITLASLYGPTIRNARLQNVNLIMQDLDGILADGADLRGTNIYVDIEKTSINNTLFASDAVFSLHGVTLSLEIVKNMGIRVDEEYKRNANLELKLFSSGTSN